MTREFKIDTDGKFYYNDTTKSAAGDWKKVSSKTFTLGATETFNGAKRTVTDAAIDIIGDSTTQKQVAFKQSGNNVIVYVYKIKDGIVTNSVLGKVVLKNIGTKATVEHQKNVGDYTASLTTAYGTSQGGNIGDFFTYEYHKEYTNIDKAVSLKGTYLNETFLGGNKNDTIKGVGGTNDITGGKGYDKMYGGENDDTFHIAQGDATLKRVEFKDGSLKKYTGTGDVIYSTNQIDELHLGFNVDPNKTTFTSDKKKNLIIESKYIGADEKEQMDKVTINKYFTVAGNERIKIKDADGNDFPVSMVIEGSGKIEGTDLNDTIIGSDKVDTITTFSGNDNITAKKANDSIIINGTGIKTINMNDGDGSDTVSVSGVAREEVGDVMLVMKDGTGENATNFTYAKNYQDLVITALNVDPESGASVAETLTLKNFFDAAVPVDNFTAKPGDFGNVYLNGEAVDISSGIDSITIGSVKASKLLSDLTWGETGKSIAAWLKDNGFSVPSALSNANVFVGTEFSDSFTGTTGRDIMVSTGGVVNEYTTGNGGQTGIAALGESADFVDVNAFAKTGTGLYDEDGVYSLSIAAAGADTNDFHMVKTDLSFLKNEKYDKSTFMGHDLKNYQGLTTTDGLTKIANIDLRKIGAQLKTIQSEPGHFTPASVKAINTIMSLIPSALDNMKGVSVITGNEEFDFQDIDITDENGHIIETITADSQAAIQAKTAQAFSNFMEETAQDYDLVLNSKTDLVNVLFGLSKQSEKLTNAQYNEIKKGFFNMFKNLYVGTSGDNAYTIKKSDFVAIASGEGSDTFTFSGEIGVKNVFESEEWYEAPVYEITSTLNEGESDTIKFTGLTIGDDLMTNGLVIDDENHIVYGADFIEHKSDSKSETMADVNYTLGENGEGYDFTDKDFHLTVQDKVHTYDITAQYRAEGELGPVWADKSNNIAYLYGNDIDVDSTSGYNAIFANTNNTAAGVAEFEYEYADGHDIVASQGESAGEYKVALSTKTELNIKDYGTLDNDTLILDNKLNEVKLFFNAQTDGTPITSDEPSIMGWIETGFDFIYSTELTKSNFDITTMKSGEYKYSTADVKNGADVNLNLTTSPNFGMETVKCGDESIDFKQLVEDIQEDVANWFTANQTKGYTDVYDVIANGSKDEVSGILACYNKDFSNYVIEQV